MNIKTIQEMIGQRMIEVIGDKGARDLTFIGENGKKFAFFDGRDCCAQVVIEDIVGDLFDLLNYPILVAEEVSNYSKEEEKENNFPDTSYEDSYTWTFYRFATHKGTVTIRWLGTSNGYYAECVEFRVINPDRN